MSGKHLILDLQSCNKKKIGDANYLKAFLNKLVELIKMKAMTNPIILEATAEMPGLTGVVILATSHISIHTFTDTNHVAMDVFSCKDFQESVVTEYVEQELNPERFDTQVIKREGLYERKASSFEKSPGLPVKPKEDSESKPKKTKKLK